MKNVLDMYKKYKLKLIRKNVFVLFIYYNLSYTIRKVKLSLIITNFDNNWILFYDNYTVWYEIN